MGAKSMINAALNRAYGQRVVHPQGQPPVKIVDLAQVQTAPVKIDSETADRVRNLIFRTRKIAEAEPLALALSSMIANHPALASELIMKASLGEGSLGEAMATLGEYARTRVALGSTQTR